MRRQSRTIPGRLFEPQSPALTTTDEQRDHLGPPPEGYANWSLRLLARRVVELAIVDSISHETVRRTLKKTG